MEKLRIAQVAPITESVPPKKYGGTQRVVSALTEELVRRGHEVTLFASGDSVTSAHLVPSSPQALRNMDIDNAYGLNPWTLLNLLNVYANADEFDMVHDHNASFVIPLAESVRTPTVITRHTPFSTTNIDLFKRLKKTKLVTVSRDQAEGTSIKNSTTIYNGLDMEHYPFSANPGEYMLFVGRLAEYKGVHIALDVSRKIGIPLILAGFVGKDDVGYYEKFIEPNLSSSIKFVGELGEADRNEVMSGSLCFVHPATFREPFGLALIEAMACGAPVVGFNWGSAPELIVDGETGFLVSDQKEMAEAILETQSLSRARCREHSLRNFNDRLMTDRYEQVYRDQIKYMVDKTTFFE